MGAAAGSLLLAFSAPTRSVTVPYVTTAAIVESATSIGVADSNLYFAQSQSEVDKALDELQALGVQNVRIAIPWALVQQQGPTSYNWTNVDRIVNSAYQRGMGVLGVINKTPLWVGGAPMAEHPDPDVYAAFAATVADRYKGKVSAYEVWNEPNFFLEFNPVSPEAYTDLLKAAYTAIKAADPSATVVGGVLGSGRTIGNWTLNPKDFLTRMYAAGAEGYFDALSFHPYNYYTKFSAGTTDHPESAINQLTALRAIMEANGDADLKVWISEYGMYTGTRTEGAEQQQMAFLLDFLNTWQQIAAAGGYAGPAFIYTAKDWQTGSTTPEDNLGLFYDDWDPKLAAQALADFIASLGLPPLEAGEPTPPAAGGGEFVNPIAAIVEQLSQIIATAVNFLPNLINSVMTAVTNVINAITSALSGLVPSTPSPTVATAAAVTAATIDAGATETAGTTDHSFAAARTAAPAAASEPVAAEADAAGTVVDAVAVVDQDEAGPAEVVAESEPVVEAEPVAAEATGSEDETATEETVVEEVSVVDDDTVTGDDAVAEDATGHETATAATQTVTAADNRGSETVTKKDGDDDSGSGGDSDSGGADE